MLSHTFLHIPGIGRKTERDLWKKGIRSWNDCGDEIIRKLSPQRTFLQNRLHNFIPESQAAVKQNNAGFFRRLMPLGEAWRLYPEFSDSTVFLDIETTGLSPVFDSVTMVGLYDREGYKSFIEGYNLNQLSSELSKYSVIVTFNGTLFDLKFLKFAFPEIPIPPIHIDLRFTARKLGLTGGMKLIERRLGIKRPLKFEDMNGYDATILWSKYLRGEKSALDELIEYNKLDVVHLESVLEILYNRLVREIVSFAFAPSIGLKGSSKRIMRVMNHTNGAASKFNGVEQPVGRITELIQKSARGDAAPRIVGIDLTGSSERKSGWALMNGVEMQTKLLATDEELVEETIKADPKLVSIDSPLSLPAKGLKQANGKPRIYRECELFLKRIGINVFWCLLPSMKPLTLRGIRLTKRLRSLGLTVIESYPGAAQDILQIPRKGTSIEELKWGLIRAGIELQVPKIGKISHDELDAVTSALVGLFHLAGESWSLGSEAEGYLIVPKPNGKHADRISRFLSGFGPEKIAIKNRM